MKFIDPGMSCVFCSKKYTHLDYKNVPLLLCFVNYFGKIKKSYYKGVCRKHQAQLSNCIKKARHMGLMAFSR